MSRQNINSLVLDAVITHDYVKLKKLLDGCRNVSTIDKSPAIAFAEENDVTGLKILHAAGVTTEDAFSVAAIHGSLDVCKWFAFETEEQFPLEFQFAEYPEHPDVDAWVKQITLRGGSVTLKSIAKDLCGVMDDPSVNDGARFLLGKLVKRYWAKSEIMSREENVSHNQ